ncbi:uracil-DNA glycosylase [Bdellovibrio sp. NC01]|nr:uracil-DNA glycosylase [Bdellovibrio sp. NC01]
MKKYPGAKPPDTKSLKTLEAAAEKCRGCDLYKNATQVVFGDGSAKAQVLIVGEQPGDKEDQQGLPFVGPAGELLRHCLEEAGLSSKDIYLTNAVKHFKWIATPGKARLHQKPNRAEMNACRPWLEKQTEAIKPKIIVALGATAAQSVLGRAVAITKERGAILPESTLGKPVVISWHPSAILRSIDREDSAQKRAQLVKDLKLAAKFLKLKD